MRSFFVRLWPPLPVWKRLDLSVFAVMIYTLGVALFLVGFQIETYKWSGDLGIVQALLLGVLLGFRNKEAYERWWEARKLWGTLINDSRNFALKVKVYAAVTAAERRRAGDMICRFATALKQHLWDRSHGTPAPVHRPAGVAGEGYQLLREWHAAGTLGDYELLLLDPHVRSLMDVCGACERIQSSPVPLSYCSLLRHGTILYLLSAPWLMIGTYGYWSIPIIGLIAYFLVGTELTAESVEDPFGLDGDDLELARFCETIRKSVSEILDEDFTPRPAA